jgi:hypothetical protein
VKIANRNSTAGMLRPAADAGPGSGSPRSSRLAAGASREFRAESSQSAGPGNTVSIMVFSVAALDGLTIHAGFPGGDHVFGRGAERFEEMSSVTWCRTRLAGAAGRIGP